MKVIDQYALGDIFWKGHKTCLKRNLGNYFKNSCIFRRQCTEKINIFSKSMTSYFLRIVFKSVKIKLFNYSRGCSSYEENQFVLKMYDAL